MSYEQYVAVFDSATDAEAAVRALESAGIPSSDISQHSQDTRGMTVAGSSAARPVEEKGFWSTLFGGGADESDVAVYDRSVENGGFVVSVRCEDGIGHEVTNILERHNAIDMDERAASYGFADRSSERDAAVGGGRQVGNEGETVIGLSEESLEVGKRQVDRGTTRLRRYVVETPVEQQVSLRDETVSVERRPVRSGATVGNDAFTDKTIEVTEVDEQAVVGKSARVVEEVAIRKDVEEHVETVHDTVRREELDVDKVSAGDTRARADSTSRSAMDRQSR